jgi:hypothetical protein
MISFFDWIKSHKNDKPWLILGKGPSFEKRNEYNLDDYYLLSLNHVIEKLPVDLAHAIDLDVVLSCQKAIANNAKFLVMPFVPHVKNKPGPLNLHEILEQNTFLKSLSNQGRLLFYNHLPSRKFGQDPIVEVRYFSSEAAINLLAMGGVHKIRTLGVDGGNTYGTTFSSLNNVTLLANGRKSFNKQFEQIAKTIMKTNIDLAPLDIPSPIKVYVATTEAQMLAVKVLEYSIRKHASMSVEIIPLHQNNIDIPKPDSKENWPKTPFSFQRFLIPELQSYSGRAIYLDSDMQVFNDIKELWIKEFNGNQVLTVKNLDENNRKPQFSVMLLDCEKLNWSIKAIVDKLNNGKLTYKSLMHEMVVADNVNDAIAAKWNSLERFVPAETALLHYTDMNLQPWVSRDNPLAYLWFEDLFEAIDQGFIDTEYIKNHIASGYIRPSVMYQIDKRIADPVLLPKEAIKLDENFEAPYQGLAHVNTFKVQIKRIIKAYARNIINSQKIKKLKKIRHYFDRS